MSKVIFTLGVLLSCYSCVHHERKPVLECIIDTYISEFSMRLGDEISLFESHDWTDSTLNLSILSIKSERLESGKYFFSEYEDAKLYMTQGKLYQNGDGEIQLELFLDKNKMVSNNLSWTIIKINNNQEEGIVPPEQFDEVQIMYNPTKNCIEESNMMGKDKFKDRIKSECDFCN